MDDLGLMFGVFDGHNGHQVADILTAKLHTHLLAEYKKLSVQPNSRNEKLINAHVKAYEAMDAEILAAIESSVSFAKASPFPEPDAALDDLYADQEAVR